MQKSIHLICNAHLDPVWLWQRNEGIAEALSTFRIAANFCEKYPGFIFCHNEAILYEWVEQYEPKLFERIRKLVKDKRWHIMGGWYLQPDCNMISGESLIRQIKLGKDYFMEKFGTYPKTVVNFDPFGHSRGLVQILKRAGFDSCLFMRPAPEICQLPAAVFRWRGYDGSEIIGHRIFGCYMTLRGQAGAKLREFVASKQGQGIGALTWGIGNHGGGPSRIDLEELNRYIEHHPEMNIKHSTPDEFFKEFKESGTELPVYDKELNFFATGCYTSQIRIKQQHRKLESELILTEKMLSAAKLSIGYKYPAKELREVENDLAFCEFHDILPGSGIRAVEEDSLRQIAHGREILDRLRLKVYLSMLKDCKPAEHGIIPLFIWNPHPYSVNAIVECEMQLADQNWNETFFDIYVFDGKKRIPSQIEHEASNLNLDWRKKVVLNTKLPPSSIIRYDCHPREKPLSEQVRKIKNINGKFLFDNGEMSIIINSRNGLIDSFRIDGKELVRAGTGRVLVIKDNADAWGADIQSYKKRIGFFALMNHTQASEFAGFEGNKLSPIRVIEDGKVRTIIETLFQYKKSTLRLRYHLPKNGTQMELHMQLNNQQPGCMYKLSWLFIDKDSQCIAQDIFGRKKIPGTREEKVFGQWFAAVSEQYNLALGGVCDSGHGIDFYKGEIRYSLMRSPCYSALPIKDRSLVSQDRVHDRIDIGQREFRFKICGGSASDLLQEMERISTLFSEAPPAIVFFPGSDGRNIENKRVVELSDRTVAMTCCKSLPNGQLIVRLFNPDDNKVKTRLSILGGEVDKEIELLPFEVKSLNINLSEKTIKELCGV